MGPPQWLEGLQPDRLCHWIAALPQQSGLASLSLTKPRPCNIAYTLHRGQRLGFNHEYTGNTPCAPPLPSGTFPCTLNRPGFRWQVDHVRAQIGQGRLAYNRAVKAVMKWKQMDLGWTTVQADSPRKGSSVCVLPHVLAFWMRLPLQVTYVSEGKCKTGRRLAVAHSTLEGHALRGEERFTIEWHKQDDSVWYDLYTVSKPATPVAKLSYPIIRLLQRRFQKDTFPALEEAISREEC